MRNYPAHLDAMWQKAIAPREQDAPTVISTFAGGGGSLTGYMMAGYRDLLAVEWDDNAVQTLRLNWPELDIYHGDIAKLTVDEVLKRTGLKTGELDILDGSPPCQGFSTAGKRMVDDPRNQLFKEYVRLLRGLKPKVFVMENVSGMVKGKMKLVFVEILKELKASGYKVSAKLLNAMYFHVPQSRERMIFIGVREDLGIEPSHPRGESRPFGVPKQVGAKDKFLTEKETQQARDHKSRHLAKGNGFGYQVLSQHKPAPTWPKTQILQTSPLWADGETLRAPSLDELHYIGSYPVVYNFRSYDNAWERIGNSVPPLFMEAIARHIRHEILGKCNGR